MQLHVLGPAFGLPSIDAECLAAVALLQLHSPPEWGIRIVDDLTYRLPSLVDGAQRIEGFEDIARYISKQNAGKIDVEKENKRADAIALASFLRIHAQTLLDISLYVSYENYSTTRSAFTKILPWFANYVVPPRRREDARTRTSHLGISSIDVDDAHEDLSNRASSGFADVGKEKGFEADAKQRASVLLPNKNTVRSLLGRPEHSAVFKLHALADNFFGPLEDMLGDAQYFMGTQEPQAVDCLVYGYLALMLYPPLPHDWLATTLRRKYAKLAQFTERMHTTLKMQTDVEAVMKLAKSATPGEAESVRESSSIDLPFQNTPPANAMDVTKSITHDLASRIPIIGPPRARLIPLKPSSPPFWQRPYFPAILAATAASLSLSIHYTFTIGLFTWPRGEAVQIFGRKKLSDYGDLGAALAGISMLSQQANDDVVFRPTDTGDNPVRVEVEVEKDELT